MQSRRTFLEGLAAGGAALVVPACRGNGGHRQHPRPDAAAAARARAPAAAPPPQGEAEEPEVIQARQREALLPPPRVEARDALGGIRRIKPPSKDLIEVAGNEPAKMLRVGIEAFGGPRLFLERGMRVVLAPNVAWARPPGAGITTEPELLREMILICQEAGARDITCLDFSTDATPRAFRINGALEATKGTRARLLSPQSVEQYVRVDAFNSQPTHASKLKWQAVAEVLTRCDLLVSMPVFKHHREVGITGSIKKMMGCIWRRRAYHDAGLHDCLAELTKVLRSSLSVVDATRVLAKNGPEGPGLVAHPHRLLVSADPVLADTFACRYIKTDPREVPYLRRAAALGAGSMDLRRARIERVKI